MIGIAIIISRGLLKTGLGMRIGYLLIPFSANARWA